MELSDRQKFILTLVVHEYIRTAIPVGSKSLVAQYQLEMSSATVRNEMGLLTEMGYLQQPHTSAGRVPTEEGYRYFVGRLLRRTELPDSTQYMISHQFYQTRPDVDEWMKLAASILASQSHAASLVTAPHSDKARFKHIELVATRGQQVLMVLVLLGGEIRQRFVTLDESISQERLSTTANQMRMVVQGMNIDELIAYQLRAQGLEKDAGRYQRDRNAEELLGAARAIQHSGFVVLFWDGGQPGQEDDHPFADRAPNIDNDKCKKDLVGAQPANRRPAKELDDVIQDAGILAVDHVPDQGCGDR